MLITIIFFLLIIITLTYYYHNYLKNHFWYNFEKRLGKNLEKKKFYSGKLHPNIYLKKNLKDQDIEKLAELYKNYLQGIVIDKEKIVNFLSIMPHSEIFYMKVNSIYYGAVMNSIIEIEYKNKKYLSNFVDNAIINKNYRDKGIFKELMNYVSNYSNEMNAKFIIFKIDKKPIPSFYKYNTVSNYFYMSNLSNYDSFFKENNLKITRPNYKNNDQFFKYLNSKNIIILSCSLDKNIPIKKEDHNFGISPFFKDTKTIMILKKNSLKSIELLYIQNPIKECINNIMSYIYKNYIFDIFFVDDVGNNSYLINIYPNLFKIAYPVYHYILGLEEKIAKENFFYYF
jgi:hypothetical protein